ncbi:NIPSNAP family protein [Mesorhizobium sp. NPDC059054]|uniref:NIPSNAP family protein n=1 Tax=Mesorhizobium sp. NPDC059054 TaxID=3346711 RepID=UPI0036AC420F
MTVLDTTLPAPISVEDVPVVELRRYALVPGQRETLIELFDREFVETQEAADIRMIGQFRDLGRPDTFVWLRGFASMDARRQALGSFYDGPVWARHRDQANATMVSSDDVLLLRPAWPGSGFDLTDATRPVAARPAANDTGPANPASERLLASISIEIHHLEPDAGPDFASSYRALAVPALREASACLLGAYLTEPAENTFPHLPVRENENVFVSVIGLNRRPDRRDSTSTVPDPSSLPGSGRFVFARTIETLWLSPTSRSLLR